VPKHMAQRERERERERGALPSDVCVLEHMFFVSGRECVYECLFVPQCLYECVYSCLCVSEC